jgi:large subunit ribosomal protein L25
MLSLTVEKKNNESKNKSLVKAGRIPSIYYGPKQASTPISIDLKSFSKVWKVAGESQVIILKDGNEEHEALIHEVDVHPVNGVPRHVDFYVIEKGKKVSVKIPLIFSGISPAVKDKGAILVKVMRDVEVEAAPRDLPHEVKVDISKLVEYGDVIHAGDLDLGKNVTLKVNSDEVVASVSEAKEEVVETTPVDLSQIEVEAKGKEVKEGEATPESAPKKE